MKILRRVLITLLFLLAAVVVCVNWILPAAVSLDIARKAPAVTRIIPVDLRDTSVSDAPGSSLSYFGYDFYVPWNDLDESQTVLYPKNNPTKCKVDLHFRSGLRLVFTALKPREWIDGIPELLKSSPQEVDSVFGHEMMTSDYNFHRGVYEFTPEKMNKWSLSGRDTWLLIIKSTAPFKSAETGIFNVQNQSFKGFQQGNPDARPSQIIVELFADEGSAEFMLFQNDYQKPSGMTQPELNRMIQSLRHTKPASHTSAQATPRE